MILPLRQTGRRARGNCRLCPLIFWRNWRNSWFGMRSCWKKSPKARYPLRCYPGRCRWRFAVSLAYMIAWELWVVWSLMFWKWNECYLFFFWVRKWVSSFLALKGCNSFWKLQLAENWYFFMLMLFFIGTVVRFRIIRKLADFLTNNVKFERQGVIFMQLVENVFDLIWLSDIQRVFRSGLLHPHPRVSIIHPELTIIYNAPLNL